MIANSNNDPADLRRRAEVRLRGQRKGPQSKAGSRKTAADTARTLHELEVHQIELEMQNAELQKAREALEAALENYTDLYDFAPVGYFSLDESGVILEANLMGAAWLGVQRSRLINRRLSLFVMPAGRPAFGAFLRKVFSGPGDQDCEALLLKENGAAFWAAFRAAPAVFPKGTKKWCRIAFADITVRKKAEATQRRVEVLSETNRSLKQEIARRQKVESALRTSEQHYSQLLDQSRAMQDQLRLLSRQVLSAQEEERKKISRELHDVIAQTLTGINVRLTNLKKQALTNTRGLNRSIALTQRLVEQSVAIVHRFARELRPTVLDDLGLIPALHTFMKSFREQTGIHVTLSAFAEVERVNGDKRTVLYRVAQEALINIARHARASQAEVKIQKLDGAVCMKIKDNGKGFQEQRGLRGKKAERLGLLGMRERIEMVGGKFTVTSARGKGTTVLAQVPLMDRATVGGGGAEAGLIASDSAKKQL